MLLATHGGPLKADMWGQRINEEAFYTLQAWMKDADGGGEVTEDDTRGDETDTAGDEVNPDDTQADEDEESQAPKAP